MKLIALNSYSGFSTNCQSASNCKSTLSPTPIPTPIPTPSPSPTLNPLTQTPPPMQEARQHRNMLFLKQLRLAGVTYNMQWLSLWRL